MMIIIIIVIIIIRANLHRAVQKQSYSFTFMSSILKGLL